MLRTTWTYGRRGAAIGASAAVVCLGAVLAACGGGSGGGRDGYVAVGAAGGPPSGVVTPTGGVRVVPLPGAGAEEDTDGNSADPRGTSSGTARPTPGAVASGGAKSGRTPSDSASVSPSPSRTAGPATPTAPTTPAALTWSEPERAAGDERWCEDVTLEFRNSGGSAVRSGAVTFGTHIIGALGVDWGTVVTEVALPAPIGAGARKGKTWTVCVDAWRVPLGMHIETRDVAVQWK